MFRVLDKDKSGDISCEELMHVFQALDADLGSDDIQEIVREFDTNGDGVVL